MRSPCDHLCLCSNSFQAAWTLSDLTSARAFKYMLPALILMVLAATWMLLYALVPAARHFGDATVAKVYASLPKHTQNTAQQIWHLLLPDVILQKVCLSPSCHPALIHWYW